MKVVFIIIFCFLILSIGWRFASRHHSLPCPSWLSWVLERDNPFTLIHRATSIVENSGIQEQMVVLDAGCGPGRITIPLAKKVGPKGQIVAMDIQNEMLIKTQQKIELEKLTNVQLLHAGLGEARLACDTFDRAVLVTVLGEIPDQTAAIKEIYNALKPGGILSVTEIVFDPHFQPRNRVIQLAHSVGFQEKARFGNYIAFTLLLEKPDMNHKY